MPNQTLSVAAAAENNVTNLSYLDRGMSKEQVKKIMRVDPDSDQLFAMDGDIYDVWFYVTRRVVLGQSKMTPLNLTPLTFKNGFLIGWGYPYYNYLKKREAEIEKRKRMAPSQPVKEKDPEDIRLEKLLKPDGTPYAPAPNPVAPPPPSSQKPAPVQKPRQSVPRPEQPLNLTPLEPTPPKGTEPPQKSPGSLQKKPPAPRSERPLNLSPLEPSTPPSPQAPAPQSPGQPSRQKPVPRSEQPLNLTPLEPSPPTEPASPQAPQQNPPQTSHLSMSKSPKSNESKKGEKPAETPNENLPFDEEDDEMFQQEREQDFNQTECDSV